MVALCAAGILTLPPDGVSDHRVRSSLRRRSPALPGQTAYDLADLGWIENGGDHRHSASAFGTAHDVQFVHLGKQPCPRFPAGARADVLILQGIRGRGRRSGLSAVPVPGGASAECGAAFPGPPCAGGIQAIVAHKVAAPGRGSLPLKYSEVEDFKVTVSWS